MANTPNIRFQGFTDDWEQRKLGEICDSFEYGLNAAATDYDGENKYIRITDIDDNSHEFLQNNVTSPDIDFNGAENYKLKRGDILFARTGASVGKTYIYKESDGLVYYAGFLIRGRVKDEYSPEFVFQNTLTADYERFIRITSQRSGQPGVNAQEYASYQIATPVLAEQQKIGAYFSTLDHLITLHQRKCDEMKKMKKFMLQKMFPKNGAKNPEIRFDGFTDDWEQRKLGEYVSITSGEAPSKFEEGTELYVKVDDLNYNDKYVVDTQNKVTDHSTAKRVTKGSVVFPKRGAAIMTNKVRIMGIDGYMDTNMMALTSEKLDSEFLYNVISKEGLYKIADTSTIPQINNKHIEPYEVSTPSLDEQRRIGAYFRNLDHLITLHQRKAENLKNLKKYMLQNMFV